MSRELFPPVEYSDERGQLPLFDPLERIRKLSFGGARVRPTKAERELLRAAIRLDYETRQRDERVRRGGNERRRP